LLADLTLRVEAEPSVEVHDRCRLIAEFAEVVGASRDAARIAGALLALGRIESVAKQQVESARIAWAGIDGLRRGAERRGAKLPNLLTGDGDEIDRARNVLKQITVKAAIAVGHSDQPVELRRAAIELLRVANDETATAALLPILQSEQDQSLRIGAVAALAAHSSDEIATVLLERLPVESPSVRRAIIDALLRHSEWTNKLLDEIEAKQIAAAELGPTYVAQLLSSRDVEIRDRAKSLLVTPSQSTEEIRRKYAGALALSAEPARGRVLFEKHCATCHRVADLGVDVGPDIADSRTKTPEQLLTDILEPNRAVDGNYLGYVVATNDGLSLTGVLASETGSSITLRQADNKSVSLLRADIAELRATGLSLMPEGWDKTLPPQEMADLISFIKNWRYLDGRTPLRENRKQPVNIQALQ
jgi:putative heme-binding domain-containing protein